MNTLTEKIYKELLSRNSVLLVGHTNSGKTYYAVNELMPFLKNKKFNAVYLANCEIVPIISNDAVAMIIDEVETLADKDFLEQSHPEDKPYYSLAYLNKVKKWHEKLKNIQVPAVFILTRNEKEEIKYLVNNINTTDWGDPVKVLVFENYKKSA